MRAGEKIDRLCRKYGLVKARLARAIGLHPTSFQYYVTDFQGQYIPLEKPWREPLRKEFLKGGATSIEVAELFGQAVPHEEVANLRRVLENLERQLSGPQPTVADTYDMHRLDENITWQWVTDEKHRFVSSSSEVLNQDEFRPQWAGKTRWELAGVLDANSDPIWRAHKSILDAHESFSGFVYNWSPVPGKIYTFVINGSPAIRRGKFSGYHGFARIVDIEETAA